ncbi:hypothetical protein GYMLUDRAFT_948045 [Collybiopsis luxurians FD-317 M1]|uniref:Uncharacterized protein n=1 Tax=Collybiopsis luxurians FD-317 M1 TaxID=944289 RepID=A0A0D0CD69_9AGAR|nr:hypothetical protein GYMLUDRAFT_948045 [Collybiopsis luxurians FD-317 M1]
MQTARTLLIRPKSFVRRIAQLPPFALPTKPLVGQNEPKLWLSDRFGARNWVYSEDHTLTFEPTIENLHHLISENKFASARRVLCTLQDQGKDIPHHMIFLDAALGEINTLSSVTHTAFFGWLNLIPAKHHPSSPGFGKNPFRFFNNTLFRSGNPSRDLEVILGMVKIASSKGYFFEQFQTVTPLMTRLVKPQSGLVLMLELEKSYIDYVKGVWPRHAERHAFMVRKVLILACCEAKGRWLRMAMKLLKLSKREGIPVSADLVGLVQLLKRNEIVDT